MNNSPVIQSRNAPCACGSGRRYKNCCGAATAAGPAALAIPNCPGWEAFSADERAELWQKMQDALAAQRALRNDTAGRLYEEVVARAPLTPDAVHMLGVVRLMEGDLDTAESLLTRAAELSPEDPAIRHNQRMLAQQRQDHEGLYSVRAIVATDMLRLHGAALSARTGPHDGAPDPLALSAMPAPVHVVIPGDVGSAGSNRTGTLFARRVGDAAQLWSGPTADARLAAGCAARMLFADACPTGGTLVLFGLTARVLTWLPEVGASFASIIVVLDGHDPATCVELLGRLPAAAAARVRFVARCAALLDDLGLPGSIDPLLFGDPMPGAGTRPWPGGPTARIGVFIPALRDHEDAARWNMLEWLRGQDAFLRVLYAGRLPSPHIANGGEHLVGLATDWDGWMEDLDALFYWGAEGHMRQYDRLVFEAAAARLMIVADGLGDFGAALKGRPDCVQFFSPEAARDGMRWVLGHWPSMPRRELAA